MYQRSTEKSSIIYITMLINVMYLVVTNSKVDNRSMTKTEVTRKGRQGRRAVKETCSPGRSLSAWDGRG